MRRTIITPQLAGMAACAVTGMTLLAYSLAQWDAAQSSFAQFLAALAVLSAVLVAGQVYGVTRTAGGHKIEVRTEPGHEVKVAARHEGGHVALAKAGGGKVLSAEIYPDGSGVTWVKMPANATVVDEIAVCVAGEVAARTSSGCCGDQANVRAILASLPAGQRAAARSAGYNRARSVVGGFLFDGGTAATAEKLLRDGRL